MAELSQTNAPIYEALRKFRRMRIVPFDVPGHKRGRGNMELTEFLGEDCMSVDVNSMKPLDNLCHPVSVIKDAEALAAEAFGAANAFFMVGGTTSAVQSMIMYACKEGDKIIMPRNVHRSAINALIMTGAVPVYVNPDVNTKLGIALGMSVTQVEHAIRDNPDAKAIMVNNPTYYGICSDLKKITELAHAHGMLVLVDEAHGTHFYFGENFPLTAMAAGADCASVRVARSRLELTQTQSEQAMQDFRLNVQKMVRQYNLQAYRVKIAYRTRETALRRYEVARWLYVQGRTSLLELNTSINEKDNAQRSFISALQTYWSLYYGLRSLTLNNSK